MHQQLVARLTGLGWLIIFSSGIFAQFFVRNSLIVRGDAAMTASNIMSSQSFFRLGILADITMLIADVAVALALYMLLKPVHHALALLAAFFRLVQAAVLGANLSNLFSALHSLNSDTVTAFTAEQRHTLALNALMTQATGYDLGLFFFAFALFTLGYLFYKSAYVPKLLGVLLVVSGLVYLLGSSAVVIAPAYISTVAFLYVVPVVAELALALWLLFKGVRVHVSAGHPPAASRMQVG